MNSHLTLERVTVTAKKTATTGATVLHVATTDSDQTLVRRCLDGDEDAWSIVIDRYKRLIYSIPLNYGVSASDAGDIFQAVCVELVTELPKLRKPESLKSWLISVTQRKALKAKHRMRREQHFIGSDMVAEVIPDDSAAVAQVIEGVQREQAVREAVRDLPERCQELVRLLFFSDGPPVPYVDVAARLGLAVGSIGFIRGRCLKKLATALAAKGV